jgi:hypothetical protein
MTYNNRKKEGGMDPVMELMNKSANALDLLTDYLEGHDEAAGERFASLPREIWPAIMLAAGSAYSDANVDGDEITIDEAKQHEYMLWLTTSLLCLYPLVRVVFETGYSLAQVDAIVPPQERLI